MSFNQTVGPPRERLSRPRLYMGVAELHGQRSTCRRAQVGVTAVRDHRIIASGYVGAPAGMPHCLDLGCDIENGGCIRSVHAEANMIAWAAREGISLHNSIFWCTHSPCFNCAKLISNIGIRGLVYKQAYRDNRGVELLINQDIRVNTFQRVLNA